MSESRKNNTKNAINVKVVSSVAGPSPVKSREYGYVATAKDRRGLIEMVDHDTVVAFQLK